MITDYTTVTTSTCMMGFFQDIYMHAPDILFCVGEQIPPRHWYAVLKAYATTTALHHRYICMYTIIHKASEWQTARGEFNSASAISSVFAMLGCISACFQNGFC